MTRAEILVAKAQEMGIDAQIREVKKNGRLMTAIAVGSGNVQACMYPEQLDDLSDEEILEELKHAPEHTPNLGINIADLADYGKIQSRTRLGVRRSGLDDDVVTRRFLDVDQYVYIELNEGVVKVTEQLLKHYGISGMQLFTDASLNTIGAGFITKSMMVRMAELTGIPVEEVPDEEEAPMWITTNESGNHGAGVMCFPGELEAIANRIGSDLFVLPSSIHEVLIVKADRDDLNYLRDMVRDVNDREVPPDEILSYSVYKYVRGKDLTIA